MEITCIATIGRMLFPLCYQLTAKLSLVNPFFYHMRVLRCLQQSQTESWGVAVVQHYPGPSIREGVD